MGFRLWPRKSTRAFAREGRHTPGYSLFDWLHGYVYGRWPYLYVGAGTREHPLARAVLGLFALIGRLLPRRPGSVTFADTYHGKVVPLQAAGQLVTIRQEISLANLEQIIPYARARDIVMHDPDHIVALECPCRAVRRRHCEPLDVCLVIGEPFASFVAEHHPRRSRWITSDEAVEILRAEDQRGHVHHAFFKDAMLGRFYAICNCCSCCCGAIQAHKSGTPMLAASGYASRVDGERCLGCGRCVEACQFGALSLAGGVATVDRAACMGCGVCAGQCEQGALELIRDPEKGVPLEMDALMQRMVDDGRQTQTVFSERRRNPPLCGEL